jgi:hypothetical protein
MRDKRAVVEISALRRFRLAICSRNLQAQFSASLMVNYAC